MDDSDRRWSCRVKIPATAMVIADGICKGLYVCDNLSASGALLLGQPKLFTSDAFEIRLRLPNTEPLDLTGEVRRIGVNTRGAITYGVAFRNVSPEIEDTIQDAVLEALEKQLDGDSSKISLEALAE